MKMFTKKLIAVWEMLLTVKWASEGTQQLPSQAPGLCAMVSRTKWLHGGRDETLPGLNTDFLFLRPTHYCHCSVPHMPPTQTTLGPL